MQCSRPLRRPLWDIIKDIGSTKRRDHGLVTPTSWTTSSARPHCSSRVPAKRQHSTSALLPEEEPGNTGATIKVKRVLTTPPTPWPPPPPKPVDFEEVVRDAGTRLRDGPEPRVKDTFEFNERYFRKVRYRAEVQREKNAKAYMLRRPREADLWRKLFHTLDQATPSGKIHYQRRTEKVKLPDGVTARFHGRVPSAIVEIMERTRCHVQTSAEFAAANGSDAFTGLVLDGSPSSIDQAIELLPEMVEVVNSKTSGDSTRLNDYNLVREIQQSDDQRAGSDDRYQAEEAHSWPEELNKAAPMTNPGPLPIRSVWSTNRSNRTQLKRPQLKQIIPSTPIEFSAYVADLTTPTPRLVFNQESDDEDAKYSVHAHTVMEDLVALFADERASKLATSLTVDRAFEYCVKYDQFSYIRQMYKSLDESGYKFTSSNFDVLLAVAARKGDMHNFDYVLKLMQGKKLLPTGHTWASLHDLARRRFPKQAEMLITTMRNKGLFEDNQTVKDVLNSTIAHDLTTHLITDGDVGSFIKHYDNEMAARFGRSGYNWLNLDTLNRALNVLLTIGRTQDAFRLLAELRSRSPGMPAVNTSTLNTFLKQPYSDRDPSSAVAILKHFHVGYPGAVIPDKQTYNMLFNIAWKGKSFHMLRVVWRYACAAGHVSYEMERKVYHSLLAYRPCGAQEVDELTHGDIWRSLAGKFVVGVSHDLVTVRSAGSSGAATKDQSLNGASSARFNLRMAELAGQSPFDEGSPESQARYKELKEMLDADQRKVTTCAPTDPLWDVLERAWMEDVRWKNEELALPANFRDGTSFAEMLRRGVKVPMKDGDFTREKRKWEVPWVLNRALMEAESKG